MRVTKSMALIGLLAASALASSAYAGDSGTTTAVHIDGSKLKSFSVDHEGKVTDLEFDDAGKGLGITAWVAPSLMDKGDAKLDELRTKGLRWLNNMRRDAGIQVIRNPHSK